jgi:two-component system, cell cycle sensor histidine kinase and response regulator CckA
MPMAPYSDLRLLMISAALALVVLITDLSWPHSIASGVLYVAVVLLSWWSPRRALTLGVATVCSGFTLVGFCFSPPGSPFWLAVSNRAIALFVIWVATILLLQRKAMEETLRDNEERFRHLIEGSIQGILIHRHDKALFANQAYAEIYGYASPADILAMDSLTPLIAPHEQARLLGYRQRRLQGKDVPTHYEYQGVRKDGTFIWLENMARVVSWEGKVALQSTIYNITERKQAVERLAVRVKQMEAVRAVSIDITRELDLTTLLRLIVQRAVELVNAAGGGVVFLWDETSQYLIPQTWHGVGEWIQKARLQLGEGLTGRVAQQRTGMHVHHYQLSPFAVPGLAPHIGPMAVLAEPLLYRGELLGVITLGNVGTGQLFSAPDHELLGLFAAQAAIAIENARLFQAVQDQASQLTQANTALHTEVAERRRAEIALRESEERYRAFVAHSSEGIWRFEFATPVPITLPEDEQIEVFYAQCYLAECNDVMARMYGFTSADDIVGIRLEALLVRSDPDNLTFLRNFIRSGYRLVDAESHEVDREGNTKIFLNTFVGIVENGLLVHTWGNQRDITERRRLEERLLQTQKMAAIGTLAGGIAHDFNNILAAILGYTELAIDDMLPQNPQHGYLQEVLTAGKRARDLVQQILTFSRQTKHQRHPVHLHQLIQETLVMLRASLPATIIIQQHLDEQIGPVMVDTTQMHQVLMNLCTNAEYAMRETGGLLDVCLEAVTLGPNAAALHPGLHPGRYVRIVVHDSGHGITSEVQERIFEPFFTTKEVGEGTGMGLAVAHGIVANHGGVITVESSPGHGTTFAVYLPYTTPVAPPSQQPETPLLHGQGRILLVDDEPPLVRIGHDMLVSLGYDVVACTSAREALKVFRADADRFALVITDQTMPVMTGVTLTHELRRTRSDIPIILCTGYSHVINAETAAAQGIDAFLLKPIALYDLARTVHQVLQQSFPLVE